jgi:hypothetical protein
MLLMYFKLLFRRNKCVYCIFGEEVSGGNREENEIIGTDVVGSCR